MWHSLISVTQLLALMTGPSPQAGPHCSARPPRQVSAETDKEGLRGSLYGFLCIPIRISASMVQRAASVFDEANWPVHVIDWLTFYTHHTGSAHICSLRGLKIVVKLSSRTFALKHACLKPAMAAANETSRQWQSWIELVSAAYSGSSLTRSEVEAQVWFELN